MGLNLTEGRRGAVKNPPPLARPQTWPPLTWQSPRRWQEASRDEDEVRNSVKAHRAVPLDTGSDMRASLQLLLLGDKHADAQT